MQSLFNIEISLIKIICKTSATQRVNHNDSVLGLYRTKKEKESGLTMEITLGIYHYNEYIVMRIQLFPIVNE